MPAQPCVKGESATRGTIPPHRGVMVALAWRKKNRSTRGQPGKSFGMCLAGLRLSSRAAKRFRPMQFSAVSEGLKNTRGGPLFNRRQPRPGDQSCPMAFITSSEILKFDATFCTSSCSSRLSINRRIFCAASGSSISTVFFAIRVI